MSVTQTSPGAAPLATAIREPSGLNAVAFASGGAGKGHDLLGGQVHDPCRRRMDGACLPKRRRPATRRALIEGPVRRAASRARSRAGHRRPGRTRLSVPSFPVVASIEPSALNANSALPSSCWKPRCPPGTTATISRTAASRMSMTRVAWVFPREVTRRHELACRAPVEISADARDRLHDAGCSDRAMQRILGLRARTEPSPIGSCRRPRSPAGCCVRRRRPGWRPPRPRARAPRGTSLHPPPARAGSPRPRSGSSRRAPRRRQDATSGTQPARRSPLHRAFALGHGPLHLHALGDVGPGPRPRGPASSCPAHSLTWSSRDPRSR